MCCMCCDMCLRCGVYMDLCPQVSTPVEVTDAAPSEAPLWLQGAKIISTPGNSSSSSKCFPAPPERIDESHESHASRPEKKTNISRSLFEISARYILTNTPLILCIEFSIFTCIEFPVLRDQRQWNLLMHFARTNAFIKRRAYKYNV